MSLGKEYTYLGDGLYYHFDNFQIWLVAYNGIHITNQVALDPETLRSFLKQPHVEKVIKELNKS